MFWSVNELVPSREMSTLVLEFELPSDRVTFIDGGVRFLTDMTDLYTAHFFERWGPTSFEQDAYQLNLTLKILNSTVPHRLFTNGSEVQLSSYEWKITFPKYFTTSSFYVHLTNNSSLQAEHFQVTGEQALIPVTVYSSQPLLIKRAKSMIPSLFQEFEKDFGPYPHQRFVVYLNGRGGGMEYSGATMTSLSALDHELFHSWFARSVMPAEGRSGWIDEAFASWRDYGYFQAASLLKRSPTRLASFSPFRKSTPENCYKDGRHLISELDRFFAAYGGMKPLMKEFFQRYKNQVVTNEEFWSFLKDRSLLDVDPFFDRYTLGDAKTTSLTFNFDFQIDAKSASPDTKHPPPLTESEVQELR